ncbi:MAG: UDP-3-O-(3-hydroxymyristoyl)glucosamine N-acyltransferase [Helicobacteraceae bacterium]|jgi:UDP-3-O-[3-hydroxymyristoyl] glucosamine N-acyltransferase|nr:UDP-3-O-(3-hydroxymyristoyl)glucosamine N-acyltransferase [Helicobacteraceae bacterium]
MKLSELADELGLRLDAQDREITRINTPELADENTISFISSDNYVKFLPQTNAAAIVLRAEYKHLAPASAAVLISENPHLSFALASAFFTSPIIKHTGKKATIGGGSEISDKAHIGQDTIIGEDCLIMAGAYIGDNVTLGDNSIVYPNVTIYNRSKIGARARIHAGAVIGSDGFGYAQTKDGTHVKIRHIGRVVIEEDVEIGANTTIDRAVLGETIIKRGTKIDNLVHIAHNCEIGEHSLITAHVVFAGSVKAGRNLVVGGHTGFNGHIEIAPFVTIAAKSGVTKSIKKSGVYSGFPAIEHHEWLKRQAKLSKAIKNIDA